MSHVATPPQALWDGSWHLRAELARILDALTSYLQRQRQRGRTPAGDPVQGLVIEEGEAEGLIAEIAGHLSGAPSTSNVNAGDARSAIAHRADAAVAQGAILPLRHAQQVFDLTAEEYDAVLLALAVEIDPRFGRIIAYLNDHVAHTRPTLGLAVAVSATAGSRQVNPAALIGRPFLRDGLLELHGDAPLPGRTIGLATSLVRRLTGVAVEPDDAGLTVRRPETDLIDRLVLEAEVRNRLLAWSDGPPVRQVVRRPLVVAGVEGGGRATAARSALFRLGIPVVDVELAGDALVERLRVGRREARWHGAGLLLRVSSTPQHPIDWAAIWRSIDGRAPVALVVTPDQVADATAAAPIAPAVVRLDEPDVTQRTRLWSALLPRGGEIGESELGELATRFPFGPGKIARAINRATADLALRPAGERRLAFSGLFAAARAVDAASIGPLAQKMPLPYERRDLIVPSSVAAELDLAVAWVRHRHRVLHEWGFVRRVTMGHGLTALFSGPSGTGKTMAAQVLARELGLELFRIDLSQIMSKYIGETEKNLALVFGARIGVLFFDEAEVILGRRHETKDARDRYANVEIAYLLQRMEEYDGVTVLATNRVQDIDDAFIRRLHVVIDFPMPSEAERGRIWEGMIPASAQCAPDVDLRALAHEFELSGGQIKNAALAAAYLAAADDAPIGMSHLRRAAKRELVKSGKIL